ncbi:hypothetical protein MKZ38_007600 [Zalerion maritima]|uniref:Clustered mitochondria protein homolog n=1 Tax=Zalerion maritima TaxID=339359 RepID=A0AAD5RWN7_9PEZI|nr:hypothetical protein MKZ38_007600 [Zalerion maritima]
MHPPRVQDPCISVYPPPYPIAQSEDTNTAKERGGIVAPAAQQSDPENSGESPPQGDEVENKVVSKESGQEGHEDDQTNDPAGGALIPVTIILPETPGKVNLMVSPHEQVHELRQSIQELPVAFQYSCFHLEHADVRINDYIQVSEIPDIGPNSDIKLIIDPYTEKEARLHLVRIRELIGAAGDRTDTIHGILAGTSLFDTVLTPESSPPENPDGEGAKSSLGHNFDGPPNLGLLLPKESAPPPKTVKSISLSSWNPPPPHLRQKGHLLYLIVTTTEGEQFQITSHVGGFYVNRSSNSKFDPSPRSPPKKASAHSLLTLIDDISPSFFASFARLQEFTNRRDPLATFQITNATPAAPWLVPQLACNVCKHQADITRSQESYLMSGIDSTDTLRDWNEEFQSARELPKDAVQDRVFRERLSSKLFADYTDAAAKGAVLVARGEVAPLNPTEGQDAQIFVYNNVFFSFGADGVGTFTSEGGDEAARVATGKDVMGVRLVNQLDVEGIFTPATVVVDYLGRRIVGQSIVPGIFKQREPGENQIDYGAVDGRDVVAADERFSPGFAKLSTAFRVKKHPVWDKDGKRFDLEGSVETKGLLGTDGRKYVLDLYRITPLDIAWLDECQEDEEEEDEEEEDAEEKYPHRMTVLRPELVEAYARQKMREYIAAEHEKARNTQNEAKDGKQEDDEQDDDDEDKNEDEEAGVEEGDEQQLKKINRNWGEEKQKTDEIPKVDLSGFKFGLNPDVFSGQTPQTDSEKKEMIADEQDVRSACVYLREKAIPELLNDLKESEMSFPMDGHSLSRVLHKRGINMRYLGKIVSMCRGSKLEALADVCTREMIARSLKHIAARYLRYLPLALSSACISHLLNCILGYKFNPKPVAEVDQSVRILYPGTETTFEQVSPESLRHEVEVETFKRYRHTLNFNWQDAVPKLQLLRELSLKLGLQLQSKNFRFDPDEPAAQIVAAADESGAINGSHSNGQANGGGKTRVESNSTGGKKKRKKGCESSPVNAVAKPGSMATFSPDDIVNVVPIIKDSAPRSSLAEEALEAGRISLAQNQTKLGQDLLLESLSLHEQIYGILHPEVARVYHQLSLLYFQLEEKEAAIELARKAIIVAERTIGIDSEETLLNYLNLSLFLHQAGDSDSALSYAQHALEMWKIIFGANHPDSVTTINNAAVMLQHLKAYHESRLWFEESLRICEKVFGKRSANSATLLFQLAQALALDGDASTAVSRMRDSYTIFKEELGADDKNTKEAESWLHQLTQSAVAIRKNAKEIEARRLQAGIRFPTRSMPSATPAPISSTVSSSQDKPAAVDQRSIDELLKFIEGSDQKKGSKKPGRGNPKRRGKA